MQAEIARAQRLGLSDLTIQSRQAIKASIDAAASDIARATERTLRETVSSGYGAYANIDTSYVAQTFGAGATQVTGRGLARVAAGVNKTLLEAMSARVYQDGYTLSDRIWGLVGPKGTPIGIVGDYQTRVLNTIQAGLAQGRDVTLIAKDLGVYLKDGRTALSNRYGRLVRGTKEWLRRIPGRIDWRALRLVRSELYASIQSAVVIRGQQNPGATGMYDWLITTGAVHDCVCPRLAEGGPYEEKDVPSYPHPNCLCTLRPQLRDPEQFSADVAAWTRGEPIGYLDAWYGDVYSRYNRMT